ncbi:copper transporter [Corallococcus praedator]|uniref:Copper transporter n=1 Tax=Corallococcus praedator TaxID=2316724 RepID=A0ABX9QQP5_9BACT|nr:MULTISPECIES: cupredoxin domain-containing protein [Corallococcus]RKH23245.1 copper transporter [Corallococcus sp. CA031C]RKI15972.1 copper transporter [Corallococcus praedator]
MRPFFSRIIKPWLALTAAAIVAGASQQACTKDATAKAPDAPVAAEVGRRENGVHVVELAVTEKGYEPSPVQLKQGEPVKLVVTRKTDMTCATELVMDEYKIDTKLPLNTPVEIAFTPSQSGTLRYGCAMGKMIAGTFVVE